MLLEKPEPSLWIERYGDYLYNYAVYRVSKEETARDLVQDTFLGALKSLESFRGEANEKTWLTSILKRKIIDYYRKASNRLEVSSDDQKMAPSYDHFFNAEDENKEGHWKDETGPAEWNVNATGLESREFVKILTACIGKLPEKWAAVFNLKLFEEQETDIICKDLKLSTSNYWVIMHRARLQLRECLEKNWFAKP
ncbi:MAG: sigma-70 family RNA polymerase sigma factor [Bacteroidia bacterium]|nr:sigma-70 family RNA polymerase sigma factor [Bacteroidia bacterium]